jgi:hypothetical protein
MKATLALLAVTMMKTGVCLAGVRAEAPNVWVRPVREFGSVLLGDITYPATLGVSAGERRVMRPFDLAEITLARARHEPPHVEDWTCDFAHTRPRLVGVLPEAERAKLLDAAAGDPASLWTRGERSLCTLAVEELSATFQQDAYTGKYEARLRFAALPEGAVSTPCTDLKWRALGRRLLAQHPGAVTHDDHRTLTLDASALCAALGCQRIWLALGLTRAYDGRHWPLVVGVHTQPDFEADVDYQSL